MFLSCSPFLLFVTGLTAVVTNSGDGGGAGQTFLGAPLTALD